MGMFEVDDLNLREHRQKGRDVFYSLSITDLPIYLGGIYVGETSMTLYYLNKIIETKKFSRFADNRSAIVSRFLKHSKFVVLNKLNR